MADPVGVCIAPGDGTLEASPTWTRLDTTYIVQGWQIDRGRSYELDRTGTGTASIDILDTTGAFDFTNAGGAFFGTLNPMCQVAIALQNPTNSTWKTRFRGFITSVSWVPYTTELLANVRIECADAFALFAKAEMTPDGTFGNQVTAGNIVFNEDLTTNAVQTRMNLVLTQYGWPAALRNIFTGNVKLQRTVYPPRTPILSVLQDTADAEFPGVANAYMSRDGIFRFRGRLARFDPNNATYGITTWGVGDKAAAAAAPTTVVPVAPPLAPFRDDTNVYTAAIATPENIADADIAAQYIEDFARKGQYGTRTWSAENLATAGGTGTTALLETKKFSTYIRDNFSTPKTRVGQITIKQQPPAGANGSASWALQCGIQISDVVHLKTTHGGGGGFNTDFFVEGIHETALPLNATHPQVTTTLDVSPVGYFSSNPF